MRFHADGGGRDGPFSSSHTGWGVPIRTMDLSHLPIGELKLQEWMNLIQNEEQ